MWVFCILRQITCYFLRSWEGKEYKFARYKSHVYFNLTCPSQNIVPKEVKFNLKQFETFQEKQIICKTHRSILNSHVRQCNRIIEDLKSQINKIKDNIKTKSSNKDFTKISNLIIKSKEKVFKTTKQHQIEKFNFLQNSPAYSNTLLYDHYAKMALNKQGISSPCLPFTFKLYFN